MNKFEVIKTNFVMRSMFNKDYFTSMKLLISFHLLCFRSTHSSGETRYYITLDLRYIFFIFFLRNFAVLNGKYLKTYLFQIEKFESIIYDRIIKAIIL